MLAMDRSITRSASLVFDVREWFASTFGPSSAPISVDGPSGKAVVKTIVRPETPLVITAEPPDTPVSTEAVWPFPGPVELVAPRTPAGLLAFFGRARVVGGGPLRRLPLANTRCNLRIEGPGYVPVVLKDVHVPAPYEKTEIVPILLMPACDYPFPAGPTLLRGGVYEVDGTPAVGVKVKVESEPQLKSAETDDQGRWLLVLDKENGSGVATSPLRLTFSGRGAAGTDLTIPDVEIHAGRVSRMPQTFLRGRVVQSRGEEVAGARVEVSPFTGESRTRPDGTWLFYPGLDVLPTPTTKQMHVTVKVSAEGRPPVSRDETINLGEATTVSTITV